MAMGAGKQVRQKAQPRRRRFYIAALAHAGLGNAEAEKVERE
jgi:hypothetical protein